MLTQLLNHVSKAQSSTGEYRKKRGPRRRKFINEGLFRALNRAGAWTRAGAGVEKENTPPRVIDWDGAGIGGEARQFHRPGGHVTNTSLSFLYPSLSAFVVLVGCTLAAAVIH